MKLYLTILSVFIAANVFAFAHKGELDSLKMLVEPSLKAHSGHDTVDIDRLNQLAAGYFDSNPDSTLYYGQISVNLSRKINYKAGIANGLVQIGHVNYFKGKFKLAQQNFDAAVSIYKHISDKKGLSKCYEQYGLMYNLLANYKSALNYLNLALDINEKAGDEPAMANCYKSMGIVYFSKGEQSVALDYYYKALFIDIKEKNDLAAAANYNDIGDVLQHMEVYPKALEYFSKGLMICKTHKDLRGMGVLYQNIGEVQLAQKNYDSAIDYLSKAMNIVQKQDDKEGISAVYTDQGLCYARKGQFKQAINYLDKALQIAGKYKIVYNEAYTLIGYATVYNLQKNYKDACKYALQGQKLAGTLGNLSVRANAALQLNETLAGLGKFDEAYALLKQYNLLKENLNNNESIQKLTSYSSELNFEAKEHQFAEQQYEKEILLQQRFKLQRLISAVFLTIILGMIGISTVYYRQKRKQQKINLMLEEKNREVVQQKTDLDEQAKKLNELNILKDRLMSVLAHDLRSPLSTLRGLFSLLQDQTISHEQMLALIPEVLKKLDYTAGFLDTLLFWINSQMENFENVIKSFSIKDIIASETENYHEAAALKGIAIVDNTPCHLIASADPDSIRIVVRNLITNAIKFSRKDDIIEIKASKADSHTHIITVKDSGIGITGEQVNKLFKNKVSSKEGTNHESGTGMGLLFCKDLIEKSGGKIWVTSKPGRGSEFSFSIPAGVMTENRSLELV